MNTFEISLNGECLVTDAVTLQALLQAQNYSLTGALACAVNKVFVPRPQWVSHSLQHGDRIDIVTPITGG